MSTEEKFNQAKGAVKEGVKNMLHKDDEK